MSTSTKGSLDDTALIVAPDMSQSSESLIKIPSRGETFAMVSSMTPSLS